MDFDELLDRCHRLKNILSDPDRPFFQVEIATLLYEFSGIIETYDDEIALLRGQLAKQSSDLESLRTRYTELQYSIADLKQTKKAV